MEFIQYLKDPVTHEKFGVMVAKVVEETKLRIGYSVCNVERGDVFDKTLGLKIAEGRTTKPRVLCKSKYKATLEGFADRAKKYFQDKQVDFEITTYSEVRG